VAAVQLAVIEVAGRQSILRSVFVPLSAGRSLHVAACDSAGLALSVALYQQSSLDNVRALLSPCPTAWLLVCLSVCNGLSVCLPAPLSP
jgi:hypothetical protein